MRRGALLTTFVIVAAEAVLVGCPPSDFLGTAQPEAGLTARPAVDGGIVDAGEADAAPARDCRPQEPGGLPGRYAPAVNAASAACDESTRASLAACFSTQKPSACLALLATTPEACRACIVSEASAPTWGATVHYEDGTVLPNQAGCWEASAPDGGVGCGPKIQRRAECEYFGVCWSCTDPAPTELNACFKAATANDGPCRKLQVAEQECTFPVATDPAGAPTFERCIQTSGAMPLPYWKGLFDFFCGP